METETRAMAAEDWEQVREIYLAGIATGQATFETSAPSWTSWHSVHLPAPRLVAVSNGKIAGWAALSPVSARTVYAGVAEVSVYVDEESRTLGIGFKLLDSLVQESEKHGIWTLQAGIFPENTPSISLHNSCGFRLVGTRERIGRVNGVWRDTLLFERRSKAVGAE
ncbi:MAG: N-acetyltransferase family protein [Acidobacteriota bacterium]